ncbi:MAG: hypothetical protein EAZ27_14150, partial [Cytophagales bacterium]
KYNWTQLEIDAYDYASMREQDARGVTSKAVRIAERNALIIGEEIGESKSKEKGIVKSLKRGKLTLVEIAEDFEVSLEFVLEIKEKNNF